MDKWGLNQLTGPRGSWLVCSTVAVQTISTK